MSDYFISDIYKSGRPCIPCHNYATAIAYRDSGENQDELLEDIDSDNRRIAQAAPWFVCRAADVVPYCFGESVVDVTDEATSGLYPKGK